MAIVHLKIGDDTPIKNNFQPPARASDLKYWWRAARKICPKMPEWHERFRSIAYIDIHLIAIEDDGWKVCIERKRFL